MIGAFFYMNFILQKHFINWKKILINIGTGMWGDGYSILRVEVYM